MCWFWFFPAVLMNQSQGKNSVNNFICQNRPIKSTWEMSRVQGRMCSFGRWWHQALVTCLLQGSDAILRTVQAWCHFDAISKAHEVSSAITVFNQLKAHSRCGTGLQGRLRVGASLEVLNPHASRATAWCLSVYLTHGSLWLNPINGVSHPWSLWLNPIKASCSLQQNS